MFRAYVVVSCVCGFGCLVRVVLCLGSVFFGLFGFVFWGLGSLWAGFFGFSSVRGVWVGCSFVWSVVFSFSGGCVVGHGVGGWVGALVRLLFGFLGTGWSGLLVRLGVGGGEALSVVTEGQAGSARRRYGEGLTLL